MPKAREAKNGKINPQVKPTFLGGEAGFLSLHGRLRVFFTKSRGVRKVDDGDGKTVRILKGEWEAGRSTHRPNGRYLTCLSVQIMRGVALQKTLAKSH